MGGNDAILWRDRGLYAANALAGSAVVLCSEDFVTRWASDSFHRIFGFDPTGISAIEQLHPEDLEFAIEVLNNVGNLRRPWVGRDEVPPPSSQLRVKHADGTYLLCTISVEDRTNDPQIQAILIRIERLPDRSGFTRALTLINEDGPIDAIVSEVLEYIDADSRMVDNEELFARWEDSDGAHSLGSKRNLAVSHPLVDLQVLLPLVHGRKTETVLVPDLPDGPTRRAAEELGYTSVWLVPVAESGYNPFGLIILWSGSGITVSLHHESHVGMGAHLLTLALLEHVSRNAMQLAAVTDQLTGLRNRRALKDALDTAVSSGGFPIALMFVDLDGFKAVNDTFGHEAGDIVLAATAERLLTVCDRNDLVTRLGGDEFVVLRTGAKATSLRGMAERISMALGAPLRLGQHTITIGASAGTAVAVSVAEVHDLMRRADVELYAAKRKRKAAALTGTAFTTRRTLSDLSAR